MDFHWATTITYRDNGVYNVLFSKDREYIDLSYLYNARNPSLSRLELNSAIIQGTTYSYSDAAGFKSDEEDNWFLYFIDYEGNRINVSMSGIIISFVEQADEIMLQEAEDSLYYSMLLGDYPYAYNDEDYQFDDIYFDTGPLDEESDDSDDSDTEDEGYSTGFSDTED